MISRFVNLVLVKPIFSLINRHEENEIRARLSKMPFILKDFPFTNSLFSEEDSSRDFLNDIPKNEQKDLIENFKNDPEVFEKIYNFYYEMIFRYLLKRTMSAENAYDICADTFLKAYENFDRFKWQGFSIKVWLYRIAINNLKNFRRQKLRQMTPLEDVPEGLEQMSHDARDELKNLDKALFGDEELGRLSDAISALNPKYKKVLSLFYFSKMSQKEIAQSMDKSVSAIKSMIHRAITNLRQLMEPVEVEA